MKFLHVADLHLGRSLLDFDLKEDQGYILDRIFQMAVEQKADAIFITGDVYDKSVPSEWAVRLLNEFISRLSHAQIAVFMISGNHDSDERLNFGSELFCEKRIYIGAKYEETLRVQRVADAYGAVNVYLLPFVKASQVRHFLPDAKIETYEDAVRAILTESKVDPAERNVILAHQFVTGGSKGPALGGSEGASVQNVGLVEEISYTCFDAFDYAALGHIHAPQKTGREGVRYAGSPLKYSLSEIHNEKSVPVVTLEEKGKVHIELLPLKPLRDVRHVKGTKEQLLAPEHITDPEDYMYVTLTDEHILPDIMNVFQQFYPHTVRIDYDNAHTRAMEQVDLSAIAENRSFQELIREFYEQIYGCEISEEEMEVMEQAAKEAGIFDETH